MLPYVMSLLQRRRFLTPSIQLHLRLASLVAECLACPSYQTSDKGSSTCRCKDSFVDTLTINPSEPCSCGPGYSLENGNCVPCATGFFKSSTSLDQVRESEERRAKSEATS